MFGQAGWGFARWAAGSRRVAPRQQGSRLPRWPLLWLMGWVVALGALPAVAGSDRPHFVAVGQEAIPRGVVATLAQDRAGFLWVATGDGLVRYDGYRFQPRGRDGVEPSRANLGWVRALLATPDGKIWIGTEAAGLVVYDPSTDRLQDWPASGRGAAALAAGMPNVQVRALAAAPDGAVWVGSLGAGLMRVAPDGAPPRLYRRDPNPVRPGAADAALSIPAAGGLPDDRVLSLLFDADGALWVGTWRGLVRLPAGSERFEPVLTDGQVQALYQTADGSVWAGARDGRLWRVRPQAPDPDDGSGHGVELVASAAGAGAVTSLAEAPRGRLWVGRALGVDLHDTASGQRQQALRVDRRSAGNLLGKETTALLRDQAGSVWVGSLGGGLMRYDEPRPGLATLALPDPQRASARSLLQRRDGTLWVADESGGIWRYDATLGQARHWRPLPGVLQPGTGEAGARIEAMVETPDGGSWLAAADAVHRLDNRGRLLHVVPHAAGSVQALVLDEQQRLWICGEGGLYAMEAAPPALATATAAARVPRPVAGFSGAALAQARAADGTLWFGGSAGLFRFRPGPAASGVPAPPAVEAVEVDAADGLGNPVVIGLLFGRDGTLWVDTAVSGLHRSRQPVAAGVVAAGQPPLAFDRVSERLGASGRPFGANLLQDGRGRIWSQLHVYDPAADRLHVLADAEGRHNGTGWFRAYAQLQDGRLVFGGSQGLFVVQGDRYEPGGQGPPLVLAGLLVNGDRQSAPVLQQSLALAPDQRSFAVEFAALAYQQPQAVRYAWMLEGFDPEWTYSDASLRVASYSNLDPGRYTLRVVAVGPGGVPSPQPLTLAVDVAPAWWQRPQTRALAALLPLLGVWAWLVQRSRAWQRQRIALEALVAERTAALAHSALTDPLTGLHNRRYVSQQLPADAARSLRRQPAAGAHGAVPGADDSSELVLFLVDIDHFKQVNDRYGHAAGDAVLVQMAARLRQAFREGDAVVRWGGEEFLVLARDTARSRAPELAERVCATVAETPFLLADGTALPGTCSVGFAVFPLAPQWPQVLDWPRVLNLADEALYAAKTAGRNGWFGLLQARADSAEALAAAAAQPLASWQAAGGLEVVASATLRR